MIRFRVYQCLFLFFAFSIFACKKEGSNKEVFPSTVGVNEFYSSLQKSGYSYRIYKPADSLELKQSIVIYLLHGHGGSDDDWFSRDEGQVKSILDSLISGGVIPPLTAVSLDVSDSWYVNSDTAMESIYINEFIPYIEEQHLNGPEEVVRIMAGNSAGGFGALRFGLIYPEMFRDVILLSPAAYHPSPPENSSSRKIDVFKINGVFNDSLWQSYGYSEILKEAPSDKYPAFHISSGLDDNYGIAGVVSQLKAELDAAGIDNSLTLLDGGHSWDVWRKCFKNDLIKVLNR